MPTPFVVRALVTITGVALISGCTTVPPEARRSSQVAPQSQVQSQGVTSTRGLTRRQLEARASDLERQRRNAEAAQIRARLREGDFSVGDAIVLNVAGVTQFSDTFPVRAGRVLQLPDVAPISLAGVLRSELQPHLTRQIGRYVINPTVDAYSLVRVAVAGAVARPGFYEVRPDAPVSEAVMQAGGLAREGDAGKMSVRRAGRTLITEEAVRQYVATGATLDDLSIRAGDEVRVGERRRQNWLETVRTLAYVVGVGVGLWSIGRF